MAVERAQACNLARERRGRRRRLALRAPRQLVEEAGEVLGGGVERSDPDPREVGAELVQVAAVRGQRVAREAALELEERQKVDDEGAEVGVEDDIAHAVLFCAHGARSC